ncbi:G-type lectin S-receptor-like serine/threonine-protein kinase At2g19130 [Triticum urartu]|uniref:Receptor-like serine/threonine-protein kinase n=1 Tax=Triticum urartu TaxID=4572 RepID=A0A8R7PRB7_TRIUA|nr:G-type lectin S-receptor-like serine/threonine-protein kinase At2g19130 [Triticum urartu]
MVTTEEMNCKSSISVLLAALIPYMFLVFDASQAAVPMDTLLPGQSISGSELLVSENGVFELGFFSPSPGAMKHYLGIQYKNLIGSHRAMFWLGNRIPITSFLNTTLYLAAGELYIEELGSVLWASGSATNGSASSVAVLLNTGNFVVKDQTNHSKVIWQSFDHPADALLPGAWLGLNMATGAHISLTLSKPPYHCTLVIDQSRKMGFVMSIDGHDHLGTFPDGMVTYEEGSLVRLNYPENPNDLQFMRLHMGQVSLLRWVNNSTITGWQPLWSYPSSCKISAFYCGAFSACTSAGTCTCIDGFRPSDPDEWRLGQFVSGCSRIIPSDCEDGISTDSFILLDNLQGLPANPQDTSEETSEDCEATCLSQCYCVAYSYDLSGCKIWYNVLLNLTFGNSTTHHTKISMRIGSHGKRRQGHIQHVMLIIGPIVAALLVMLVVFWVYNRSSRQTKVEGFLGVYTYTQLKRATRNFSDKLGEGGFGSVFRGTVAGPTAVAVKKLKSFGHRDKQFRAEVQTLGLIQHTNLVRLFGFCSEGARRLLVYEYMPNGSLDSHLFSSGTSVLSWSLRRRIAIGMAKGLSYLHEECRDCIIHCDIKPENILLDAEFCPKIADFGMAKLLGRDMSTALTTLRGTIGYLAPEWVYGQPITQKADVYSFGVVLLELISGRRATGNGNHRYFPLYAAAKVNEGDVLCLLDGRLGGEGNEKELDVACRVACWCIQDDEIHRPSMGKVVRMLEGAVDVELPPIPTSFQNIMDGGDSGTYSTEV